jgi:hypothetical protein
MNICKFDDEKKCNDQPLCQWNINFDNKNDSVNKKSCKFACSKVKDNLQCDKNYCEWITGENDNNLCKLLPCYNLNKESCIQNNKCDWIVGDNDNNLCILKK